MARGIDGGVGRLHGAGDLTTPERRYATSPANQVVTSSNSGNIALASARSPSVT